MRLLDLNDLRLIELTGLTGLGLGSWQLTWLMKVGPRITSASQLPDPLHYDSHRSSLNRSLSKLPEDLTSDHSMKSFRQAKLANSFLNGGWVNDCFIISLYLVIWFFRSSSISSYIGNTYRQYSSNFSSTSTGSKTRLYSLNNMFSFIQYLPLLLGSLTWSLFLLFEENSELDSC